MFYNVFGYTIAYPFSATFFLVINGFNLPCFFRFLHTSQQNQQLSDNKVFTTFLSYFLLLSDKQNKAFYTLSTFYKKCFLGIYVSLCRNVCFRLRKRMFRPRKTYVSVPKNIKNSNSFSLLGKVIFDYLTKQIAFRLFFVKLTNFHPT